MSYPTPPQPGYTPLGQPHHPYPPQWRPAPPPVAPNGQPLASFPDRLLAYIIDALILGAISLLWVLPLMFWWMSTIFGAVSRDMDRMRADPYAEPSFALSFSDFWLPYLLLFGVTMVMSPLLSYLYLVEYQLRKGQTVGKRVMKLKIIPVDPAGVLDRPALAKRWAVSQLIAIVVPLFSWIDGLWQLWDKPLQQCLHDKAADTVVVKAG